ncbi:MAG: hypothetical protein IPL61_34595 [Myxococcales bacterium]|nr:hypothetical protein [Myxococcales bacterium]
MRTLAALALVALVASPAAAGRSKGRGAHAKGKARVAAIDVAGAVASGDAARQCDAAIALVKAGQHARASLLVGTCADLASHAVAARAARIAIAKVATRELWSPVELDVGDAVGVTIAIDAFADVPVAPGRWKLPAGTYHFVARGPGGAVAADLTLEANSRALLQLAPPPVAVATPVAGVIDFGKDDGAPLDRPIAGPPPPAKHESLLPERYRKGLKRCGAMACRTLP